MAVARAARLADEEMAAKAAERKSDAKKEVVKEAAAEVSGNQWPCCDCAVTVL